MRALHAGPLRDPKDAYVCIRTYLYIHIYIYVQIYIHTHTHTHTHTHQVVGLGLHRDPGKGVLLDDSRTSYALSTSTSVQHALKPL